MAKKFGRFLMFTAVAGAVAAGAYYYLQNKNSSYSDDLDDDDDFDDFSDDSDDMEEKDSTRNYVDLNLEKAENAVSDTIDHVKDAAATATQEAAAAIKEAVKDIEDSTESKVEEFFDDDDDYTAGI